MAQILYKSNNTFHKYTNSAIKGYDLNNSASKLGLMQKYESLV